MLKLPFRTIRKIEILSLVLLLGCSRLEESQKEKIRHQNAKAEMVYRSHNDYFYPITTPEHNPRSAYPWENQANLPKITKEFFRCKGSGLNSPVYHEESEKNLLDCSGRSHGLPILRGKEDVYPILLDLLNYIQKKTGKRVIITCGHRCPEHNTYADPSKPNLLSKHQVGAEVDFYVQGMEDSPQEVVGLLMQFYKEKSRYKNQRIFTEFQRYEKSDSYVVTKPWYNKEIYIKIFLKEEGRDADNRHPYPYISIQVRADRDASWERVRYTWEKAHRGFPRS